MSNNDESTLLLRMVKTQVILVLVIMIQSCTHTISLVNKEYDNISINLANRNIAFILLTDDLNSLYQPGKTGGTESVEYYPYNDLKLSIESVPLYQAGRISFYTSLSLVDPGSFDYFVLLTMSTDEEWNWWKAIPAEFFISLNCILTNHELEPIYNFKVVTNGEENGIVGGAIGGLLVDENEGYRMVMKQAVQNLFARLRQVLIVNNTKNE